MQTYFDKHLDSMSKELASFSKANGKFKDILIVVHDQLPLLQSCLNSIFQNTDFFHVYIWNNGSGKETFDYLNNINRYFEKSDTKRLDVLHADRNLGFVEPNNELARISTNDYLIFLNSDTSVTQGWDLGLVGMLDDEVLQTGYAGCYLGEDGLGGAKNSENQTVGFGSNIDYLAGFCFAISRETYNTFGLFDPNYRFAYFEDSDFSLKLKQAGKKLYALHLGLVLHLGNATINAVQKEGNVDIELTFSYNQAYFQQKWQRYLSNERVLLENKTCPAPSPPGK